MAKTSKAPQPVTAEARDYFLSIVRTTAEPVTASQLAKLLTAPHKLSEARLAPVLDELVAAAKLIPFAPKTAKGKPRYWDRDDAALGQSLIRAALDKKGAQSRADLRKAAKQVSDTAFQSAFQGLLESNALFEHPPLPKKKSISFGNSPPSPEPYLRELGSQLTKTVAVLESARVPKDDLRRALYQLMEATGISLAPPPTTIAQESPMPEITLDLVSLIRSIEPGAANGALVASRDLRRAANVDKLSFDQSVLEFARQGRLMLHRHDFASGLSPAERDELVTDGAGTYYVGMALRRQLAD